MMLHNIKCLSQGSIVGLYNRVCSVTCFSCSVLDQMKSRSGAKVHGVLKTRWIMKIYMECK